MEKWHALGLTDAVKSGIIGLLGVIIGAIIAGIFTLGAIFITLRFQPVPEVTGRYHLIARQISEGQERLYKIDTRTGQVWFLDSKTLLTRENFKGDPKDWQIAENISKGTNLHTLMPPYWRELPGKYDPSSFVHGDGREE